LSVLQLLNELSLRGKALLLAAIIVIAPLAGWLGYRLGFALGSS
jgi:hypothetical protein